MTTQKDLKRLVRGRMQKTGESYTTARANLLKTPAAGNGQRVNAASAAPVETSGAQAPSPATADFARIAGMSDATIKEKTGCTWESWVWTLDKAGAHNWPHTEIAQYVHEKYKVPGWWTQTVTVGYERIKGLRARGQRRGGSWEASKSKTIDAAVGTVFKAFKQPKFRTPWLPNPVAIRSAVPNKSLRITWEDGTSMEVYLTSKGRSKTSVAIQHTKLASKAAADRYKAFWAEHLDLLAGRLRPKSKKAAGT